MHGADSEVALGSFRFEARARAIRVVLWLTLAVIPVNIAYNLVPLFSRDATVLRAISSREFDLAKTQLLKSIEKKGDERQSYFQYPVSELVEVSAPIRAKGAEEGPIFDEGVAQVTIRYDRLILWLGLGGVLVLTFQTLLPSLTGLYVGPLKVRIGGEAIGGADAEQSPPATAIGLFELEVKSAERRAEILFARSTLLLGGGIIMAFVGVAIFYVTLPEGAKDDSVESYWLRAIRPTGVLIFVEAIAWFLLRQYRALIEDYKWFHRLYMKRANYLAALRILDKSSVRPEDIFLAASLVQEDLSGKLRKDETTESLEKMKISEDSPVTEILRAITSLHSREKKEVSSNEAKKGRTDT